MDVKYDYLIVGAGLFGAVFAYEMTQKGKKCIVIDRRSQSGGNLYCESINGINVHKYGAHIFHTDNRKIWDYVNGLVEFNHFVNSPIANYKGNLFNLPFNMNTYYQLWGVVTPEEARQKIEEQKAEYSHISEPKNLEEQALVLGGKDVYEALIKGYTEKQWGCSAEKLPAFIIRRLPFRFTYDNNYFDHPYQGVPKGGYNLLIDRLLDGVEVKLNVDFFNDRFYWESLAEKVVFSGRIDGYFNYQFGELDYRSLHFEIEEYDVFDYQGVAVMNYTDKETPFTRIIEHKHFEFGKQSTTVVTREYPHEYSKDNEPYYPLNYGKNQETFNKYQQLAMQCPGVIFGGRLAMYKYYDMHQIIEEALRVTEGL